MKIDMSGVDELAEKFSKLAKSMKKAEEDILKEILEVGLKTARLELAHFDTGETFDSIHYEIDGKVGYLIAGGNAIWIEFGTGITKAPYPDVLPAGIVPHGQYVSPHGFMPNGANSGGWYYKKGNRTYHTMGIDSNPFMLMAGNAMKEKAKELGSKVVVGYIEKA